MLGLGIGFLGFAWLSRKSEPAWLPVSCGITGIAALWMAVS
jgi:hypothetical protein